MHRLAFLFLSLLAMSHAFTMAPQPRMMMTRVNLMSQEETEALMKQAVECSEGECSLDEVGDLIGTLKAQQKELADRVEEVRKMIETLEHMNAKDDRKVDEVRETVRAIYRVFQLGDKASGNDYPSLSRPTGWSGDVGKGSTTAYDALPPKKWKPKN